jgi:hypothetical protein
LKLLGLVCIQRSHLCIETSRPHMYAEMSEELKKEFVKLKNNLHQGRTFLFKCKDSTLMRWRDSSGSERWTTWIWAPSAGPPTAVSFATSVNCCTAVRSLQYIKKNCTEILCTLNPMHSTARGVYVAIHQTLVGANDPNPRSTAGDPITTLLTQDLRDSWRLFLGLRFRDWATKKMKERAWLPR